MNRNRRIPEVEKVLNHSDFCTKIMLYFSRKSYSEQYDPYEKNATYTNLNPITIKGYVSEIDAEALVYKMYGLSNLGAKEILCDSKYENAFKTCNKLTIDGNNYTVFKEGTSGKTLISHRSKKLIRVVVTRND